MFKKLKQIFHKEQFEPSILGLFFNPFYFSRKGLFENIAPFTKHIKGKILDVGCGQKPYKKLFDSTQYIGLEIDTSKNRQNKKADLFYDGRNFPFQDKEFDSVITNQVLEHVSNPDNFLKEINRVLKAEGTFLITAPFVWDEHEQPFDYLRYSSFGLESLLKKYDFQILEYRKSMNDIRIIFQLINNYIYKKTVTRNVYLNLLITLILISPFNIFGELLSTIMPKNDDLYLDNVFLAKKMKGG